MLGPIIAGLRLTLVPPRAEFIDSWRRWFADREVTRYLQKRFVPSPKQEVEWLERVAQDRGAVIWSIMLGKKMIGSTGLNAIDWRHRHAFSGTMIGEKTYWGKGYAKESMALRTAYAFEELGLERIETQVFEGNEASRRALLATGYREIGIRRRHLFFEGSWHDVWLGEILRVDWERAHRRPAGGAKRPR